MYMAYGTVLYSHRNVRDDDDDDGMAETSIENYIRIYFFVSENRYVYLHNLPTNSEALLLN